MKGFVVDVLLILLFLLVFLFVFSWFCIYFFNDVVKYRLPWSCDGHLCRSTPTWFLQERSQKSLQTEGDIQTAAADLGHRWCHWPASSRWRTEWMTQSAFASWGGQSVVGSPSGQNKTEPEKQRETETETESRKNFQCTTSNGQFLYITSKNSTPIWPKWLICRSKPIILVWIPKSWTVVQLEIHFCGDHPTYTYLYKAGEC